MLSHPSPRKLTLNLLIILPSVCLDIPVWVHLFELPKSRSELVMQRIEDGLLLSGKTRVTPAGARNEGRSVAAVGPAVFGFVP